MIQYGNLPQIHRKAPARPTVYKNPPLVSKTQEKDSHHPQVAVGKPPSKSFDIKLAPGIADNSLVGLTWCLSRVILHTTFLLCYRRPHS